MVYKNYIEMQKINSPNNITDTAQFLSTQTTKHKTLKYALSLSGNSFNLFPHPGDVVI